MSAIDTWYGITLNENGCVNIISLENNQLSGCIPLSMKVFCGKNVSFINNPNLATQDFSAFCTSNVGACVSNNDMALSITATPSVFTKYAPMSLMITARNNGNQAFTNVKIEFKFPSGTTNGGTVTPSVGTWQEWCAGSIQCFTWTIPTLAANTTATLNVPIYVLNPTPPIIATTKLLSSTPTDNNTANNVATISVNQGAVPAVFALTQLQPTQLIPIVIQKIAPNPSDGELFVELESLNEKEVTFSFSDALGKVVQVELRQVVKGMNRVSFDVGTRSQGIYFLSLSTSGGLHVPTKFIKL